MDDLLREFLTETAENLDVVDVEIVKLEQDPNNREVLSNIFRLVHTIKGTCGFLGLPRLEALAHAGENVLGKFRTGEMTVTGNAVSLILESLDGIKSILAVLEATEQEPPGDDADIIARLDELAEGGGLAAAPPAQPQPPAAPVAEAVPPAPVIEMERALKPGEVSLDELEAAFQMAPGPEAIAAGAAPLLSDAEAAATALVEHTAATAAPPARAGDAQPSQETKAEGQIANQTLRVSVDLLENLMTMVSELVLTRNQLLQMVRRMGDSEFAAPLQRLSHCTSELQEGVMKTRMQPIGNAWSKLPRIVRDLSHELNKKIDLQMHGAETELDRQVLDLIKDPLTHMVRNSADHGLEGPADRRAAGKPETGRITLNAYHEGGHIIIQIADDGRGLDLERIKAKALANGLVSESDLAGMSDAQVGRYIFHPGLSTADKVTSVSGRGVGMDVVKTNIEKIGGTIDLKTAPGRGTTFQIKIPLTLAIVSALIVECAGERFAVPQIGVVELVRATPDSEHRIEEINHTPVVRLRNRLLPLVFLAETLNLVPAETPRPEDAFVIVAQVGTQTFGIVVDRVFDTEEIVVKPVASILRENALFSGNTILGDGSVIMILDPNGLAMQTGEALRENQEIGQETVAEAGFGASSSSLLVFRAGGDELKAVPLALVARLEEIELKRIERSNGKPVVQYRGHLMPIVCADAEHRLKTEGGQPVIVFADGERAMGLAVDEIIDIVEDRLDVELQSGRPGLIGTAVVAGQATGVVDVAHYLTMAYDDWFRRSTEEQGQTRSQRTVLLVDDSPFFRNMIKPVLSVAGYDVTFAEEAQQALRLREQGATFDIIVSDIEMPGMDGFAFTETIRREGAWRDVPVIALSSRTAPSDFERGRRVGFTDYVAKGDREGLLASLRATLDGRCAA
ncbi:chemotaxis protein CheW [Zavarzinia compransoris]|uniref:hybrid sensor histidine kinase/response regulator n=1 Tax=Zavarzinia marina TaxID=2911065 RepID=UPI001F1E26FC|nr:chemotaxis protein CheW [Zavarzinia marina]MCF4165187.1 chemotaxis protein CheW [Zavarzinia marina]